MPPITWEWFALRAMWFVFGGSIGFFAGFLIASIFAVSSGISRWEKAQPEPEPATPERDAKLVEAEAKAEFYYRMATGQEAT